MNFDFFGFFQSSWAAGGDILPYAGAVLLVILAVLVFILLIYIIYRLGKRIPFVLRYIYWLLSLGFQRIYSGVKPNAAAGKLACVFPGEEKRLIDFSESFGQTRGLLGARVRNRRPAQPLFLVLGTGSEPSGHETRKLLVSMSDNKPHFSTDLPNHAEFVWWSFRDKMVLELTPNFYRDKTTDSWQLDQMLWYLERFRPELPLDGLIIVLTPEEIISIEKDMAKFTRLIEIMQRVSHFLEYELSLNFMITGCEKLRGFKEIMDLNTAQAGSLDVSWHRSVSIDSATLATIPEDWVKSLWDQIIHMLSTEWLSKGIGDGNFLLRLPLFCNTLAKPLVGLIKALRGNEVERRTAFILKNIFLLSFIPGDVPFLGGHEAKKVEGLAFAQKTQVKKYFRYEKSGFRSALVSFCFAIGIFLAMALYAVHVSNNTQKQVQKLLGVAKENFSILEYDSESTESTSEVGNNPKNSEKLVQFLTAVQTVSQNSLFSLMAPSSWTDQTQKRFFSDLGLIGQANFIIPRINFLDQQVSQENDKSEPLISLSVESITALPSYYLLAQFLSIREVIGGQVSVLDVFDGDISYANFSKFLGVPLAQYPNLSLEMKRQIPSVMVSKFDVSSLTRKKKEIVDYETQRAAFLIERVLSESLDMHPIVLAFDSIKELSDRLATEKGLNYGDAVILLEAIQRLQAEIPLPSSDRIVGSKQDGLKFIKPLLARLGKSSILSYAQSIEVSTQFSQRKQDLRKRLIETEINGLGHVFSDANGGRLILTAEFKKFAGAYGRLMGTQFMRSVGMPKVKLSENIGMAGLAIQADKLTEIKELARAFQQYVEGSLGEFEVALRPAMGNLAKNQYLLVIENIFSNAIVPKGVAQTAESQLGLDDVTNRLKQLQSALSAYRLAFEIRFADAALIKPPVENNIAISNFLVQESLRLLTLFEDVLKKEDPYKGLVTLLELKLDEQNLALEKAMKTNLGGKTISVSPPIKSVTKTKGLEKQLNKIRERLKEKYAAVAIAIINDAMPLMNTEQKQSEIITRWNRFHSVLNMVDKTDLNNELIELERYMSSYVELQNVQQCVAMVLKKTEAPKANSYFVYYFGMLKANLDRRCLLQARKAQVIEYENLVSWFNSKVIGRSPFTKKAEIVRSLEASAVVSVDLSALISKYCSFRKAVPNLPMDWPNKSRQALEQLDVFMEKIIVLDTMTKNCNSWVINSAFKGKFELLNETMTEPLLGHIVNVDLVIGSRKYALQNLGAVTFDWTLGEPIELRIRWANESPYHPVEAKNYKLNWREVVYRFDGGFSLFEMVKGAVTGGESVKSGKTTLVFPLWVAGVGPNNKALKLHLLLSGSDASDMVPYELPLRLPVVNFESKPNIIKD